MKKAIQLWKQAGYPYTETKEGCFHASDHHLQELPALSSRHVWIYEDGSFWAYEVGWSDDMDVAITFTKEMTAALLYALSMIKTNKNPLSQWLSGGGRIDLYVITSFYANRFRRSTIAMFLNIVYHICYVSSR